MSRRLLFLGLLPVFLSIGGCGGSSHSSSSSSSTTTATPASSASSTSASSTSVTASTSSSRGARVGGSSNVRVPATFVITAGGKLRPSQISVPPGFAVALTVVSGDGAAHRVVLASPAPQSLSVPANGRATARVAGLKKGGYPVKVDGRAAGVLVIGGQPGP